MELTMNARSSPGEPAPSSISPSTASQATAASPSISGSRHSPVAPLAPLEFLQNQRRGSITDPSLHAGPSPYSHMTNSAALSNIPSSFRHLSSVPAFSVPSTSHEPQPRGAHAVSRAASPFRFGDASSESRGSPRRPLRSSSADGSKRPALNDGPRESESRPERSTSGTTEDCMIGDTNSRAKGSDSMTVDSQSHEEEPRESGGSRHQRIRESGQAGYSARRHSITAGTKRKISSEKGVHSPGNEDIDPLLAGPGVSSVDADGPAPKRRGSAFDTQKIAQLSLYDRRNSVDARPGGWWGKERRDSATSSASTFASTPMSGYSTPSSAIPGDSPHGRPPGGIATFAWPATPQHPDQAAGEPMQNEASVNMQGPPHPYDPLPIMPPVTFAHDRRMSAPTISPENLPNPPSTGPTRVLRSRSRPPSRVRGTDQSTVNNLAGPSSAVSAGAQSDDAATLQNQHLGKESGSTPYSRSPELRISHKLAERKRRKEMKDLFDELRDQLPADRGMKASKWEILSKAIDFIVTLKQNHQDMGREIEMLRHELDSIRHGIPPPFAGGPPPPVVYGHGPPVGVAPYPQPGPPSGPPPPHQGPPHQHQPPPPHQPAQPPLSRPGSSQNMYSSGPSPMQHSAPPNNHGPGIQVTKTDPSS